MSSRRTGRRWAVQFLFQRDYNEGPLDEDLAAFWRMNDVNPDDRPFAESLVRGVEGRREEIDALLAGVAEHWSLRRMGGVDRNVMRLAVYEMLALDDVPHVVSINEAVELAKLLSDEASGKFVNGLLDRIRKQLEAGGEPSSAAEPAPEVADG